MSTLPNAKGRSHFAQLISELYLTDDQDKAQALWAQVPDAAREAGIRTQRLLDAVQKRDLEPLVKLANELETADATRAQAEQQKASAEAAARAKAATAAKPAEAKPAREFSQQELRHAYNAFKKRLKSTQRDEDSKLGGRYTSGGGKGIVAVTPPREFPAEIWEALAREGRIKKAGSGMYAMP